MVKDMTDKDLEGKVYFFGSEASSIVTTNSEVVGSKALNLIRMTKVGLPVPPGIVLSTHFCHDYYEHGKRLPKGFQDVLSSNIRRVENATRLTFGGSRRPLLISVRSGAAVSMPGMMETILNIGLSEQTLSGMIRMTGNPRMAWDSYRRLIQAYAEVVHGCASEPFVEVVDSCMQKEGAPTVHELDKGSLEGIAGEYLELFQSLTGVPFPQRPIDQLSEAVGAVFGSWQSDKAAEFRRLHDIKGLRGTAVIIQSMVFGNMGGTSGSGVAFTRDPATGENKLYMDFLFNAQGEDVVSGRHTIQDPDALRNVLPSVYRDIHRIKRLLEIEFKDVQDFEFTVQNGTLYILQSRTAKRTQWAAIRIAHDLVKEGIITKAEAVERMRGLDLDAVQRVRLAGGKDLEPVGLGIPASPGVAVGEIVLDPEEAQERASRDRAVILVREDTSTSDIAGMAVACGILTAMGGRTSHAAVVARQMDKVCIVGCRDLEIDVDLRTCSIGGKVFSEGDHISLDGNSGKVYAGELEVVIERPKKYLNDIKVWMAKARTRGRGRKRDGHGQEEG